MLPEPFEVLENRQETVDTWTLELAALSGRPLSFQPGQFTMLSAGGAGEVPISISGDPGRPEQLVQTVRAVGLATSALCAAVRGEVIGVRGPFGQSWPLESLAGADVVIAAGGLGLPPLRPVILRLLEERERYGRLALIYGGRSPDQLMYPAEIERWRERGLEVYLTVDSAGPEWLGHVGVVTRLVHRAELDGPRTVALSCGPEIMLRFAVLALQEAGVAPERIYVSTERNMQCGIGQCGHCQLGPVLVCRDGPVLRWDVIGPWLAIPEL